MYTCADETAIPDLPIELEPTIIRNREGCYPGDSEGYIAEVKDETLKILRMLVQQLGLHSQN